MLGVPFKYVTGYRSNQNARLALQQGEINFFAKSPPGYRSVVEPSLVRNGQVIPLYYDPGWNGESISVPKQVEGLAILPFQELYRKIKGTAPSGRLWDVDPSSLAINAAMQRLVVLPPGSPPAAVEALRAAVTRLNHDADFAQDALGTLGYVPNYEAGPQTNRQVRTALTVSPEIRAFVLAPSRTPRNEREGFMRVFGLATLESSPRCCPREQGPRCVRSRSAPPCQPSRRDFPHALLHSLLLMLCALAVLAPPAFADNPYYKGKRLTVLINFTAGGPTDIEGRLFAKHLADHIESRPP